MKTPSNPQEGADKEGADKSAEEPKDSSSDEAAVCFFFCHRVSGADMRLSKPDSAELKED